MFGRWVLLSRSEVWIHGYVKRLNKLSLEIGNTETIVCIPARDKLAKMKSNGSGSSIDIVCAACLGIISHVYLSASCF